VLCIYTQEKLQWMYGGQTVQCLNMWGNITYKHCTSKKKKIISGQSVNRSYFFRKM